MIHKELIRKYTRQMFLQDYHPSEIEHMSEGAIKAFIELKKIGCPVRVSDNLYGKCNDRGYFWIDGESQYSELFLDYYNTSMYSGSPELQQILEDNGLYFEWENPAYACVWED